MHRIDTPTAQVDKFGTGKNGFTNGDPSTGRRATDLNSDMWDAVQEEICNTIEKSGITLDKAQHDQLYKAIVGLISGAIPDALLRKNNLSDLMDKVAARTNLGLKSAAVADVTNSTTDTTAGRVLKVGDYGMSLAIPIPTNTELVSFLSTARGAFYHCDDATSYTNAPPSFGGEWFDIYMTIHGETQYRTMIAVSSSGKLATAAIAAGNFTGWFAIAHANDFLPLAGGKMTGEITGAYTGPNNWDGQYASKAPFYDEFSTSGTSDYHPLIKQRGSTTTNSWAFSQGLLNSGSNLIWNFHFKGSAGQDVFYTMDTSGNFGVAGRVNPGDFGNFDSRYISGVQLGAQSMSLSADASGGSLYLPTGCTCTGYTSPGSSNANAIRFYYKPIQQKINGGYVTIPG